MNILTNLYNACANFFTEKKKKDKSSAIKDFEAHYIITYQDTATELGYINRRYTVSSDSEQTIIEKKIAEKFKQEITSSSEF